MGCNSTQFGCSPNLTWAYDVSLQIDDRKVSPLERRLAITYALSATATLVTACVAIATVSGGLFAQAAPSRKAGVKQVELVDNYIVVHSPTTTIAAAPQSALMQAFIVAPAPAPAPDPTDPPTTVAAPPAAKVQPPAPAPAPPPPSATEPESTSPEPTVTHKSGKAPGPAARPMPTRDQPPTTDGTPEGGGQPQARQHPRDNHPSDSVPGD